MIRFLILSITLALLGVSHLNAASVRVEIGTLPGLRYTLKTFYVAPGDDVEIFFSNDDDMLHNMVITKPGKRELVVNQALLLAGSGESSGFVPKSDDVLWNTPVVASGESYSLRFTAPGENGDYPFVCTYPGHGFVMFGTMVVMDNPIAKPIKNSTEMAMPSGHDMHSVHNTNRSIVKRTFMPHAGPASIAVGLNDMYSYCWDAGAVRFRYAWHGGFGQAVYRKPLELNGQVFYRELEEYPIRVGDDPTKLPKEVRFLGYRLDGNGVPEFEYKVDGVRLKERIEISEGGLLRRIQVAPANEIPKVWFAVSSESSGMFESVNEAKGDYYSFSEEGVFEAQIILANETGGESR